MFSLTKYRVHGRFCVDIAFAD